MTPPPPDAAPTPAVEPLTERRLNRLGAYAASCITDGETADTDGETLLALVAAARDAAKLRERVAELEADKRQLQDVLLAKMAHGNPPVYAKGRADERAAVSAWLRDEWRRLFSRQERDQSRRDERANAISRQVDDRYAFLATYAERIERGEHVAGEREGGGGR